MMDDTEPNDEKPNESSANTPKYMIDVKNGYEHLAASIIDSQTTIPLDILHLFEVFLPLRCEYSHFIGIKDPDNHREIEKHQYYIDTMEEMQRTLSEAAADQATKASQQQSSFLGKRKPSISNLDGQEQRKAVKATSRPMQALKTAKEKRTQPFSAWKPAIVEKTEVEKKCAVTAVKPMSYAAAAAVSVK